MAQREPFYTLLSIQNLDELFNYYCIVLVSALHLELNAQQRCFIENCLTNSGLIKILTLTSQSTVHLASQLRLG